MGFGSLRSSAAPGKGVLGYLTTTVYTFSDPKLGLEAEFLDVFVSRKAAMQG
jgi:hypothetical protein